jgi:Cupin-like domain
MVDAPERGQALSDHWRAWVVDNLLHGASRDELVAALVAQDVPPGLAKREVQAIEASPLLACCAQFLIERERRDQLLELLVDLRADRPIERRESVSADTLFADYWATSTPVVLTETTRDWPARTNWSIASFRRRFGDVTVQVCTRRDADPHCDRNFRDHFEEQRFGDYLDLVERPEPSNDVYMIAHNHTMERPGMRSLLDDVVMDEALFDPAEAIGGCTLWVGPKGTLTPLHHDSTNILFCQIVGRKKLWLLPPWEASLLDDARGFYASFDASSPRRQWPEAHRQARVHELVLEPGEALFLPAGWWHQVRALDASISFSLLNFRRDNRFDDYAPGNTRLVQAGVDRGSP